LIDVNADRVGSVNLPSPAVVAEGRAEDEGMASFIASARPSPGQGDAPCGGSGPRAESCATCLLLDEADHRIANHLMVLASYVRLKAMDCARQIGEPTRDDVNQLLSSIGAQIESVARLHRALAVGHGATSADLAVHLRGICAPVRESFSRSLDLTEDYAAGCAVRPEQVLSLTQVVAEVITNAMKYAHPGGGVVQVRIGCQPTLGAGPRITITDDGVGLPVDLATATAGGLGLRLLRGMTKQLGAKMDFLSTSNGLAFTLILPADTACA
jgi:two-component sensor histidine kinase